jgi:hypothetical protein
MPLFQLFIVAVLGTISLMAMRLIRARLDRTPHPDERARIPFILAFLFVPPLVLGLVTHSADDPSIGIIWVPVYVAILGGLAIVMWIAAAFVRAHAPRESRPLLVLALVASQNEPDEPGYDPPLSATLAKRQAVVETANAVFPRGVDFPAQVDRTGFRTAWDALDAATRTLEGGIADDEGRGTGVAAAVTATAKDARARLETLRRLAADGGQEWAKA